MKAYFFLMLCALPALLVADEVKREVVEGAKWPELVLRDGRVLKDVTFLLVRGDRMKLMHAGGVLTIEPGKLMPYDTRWTVPGDVVAAEERAKSRPKEYELQVLREAQELQPITGQSLVVLQGAIRCRDWCLANPQGGRYDAPDGAHVFGKEKRDEQLKVAMGLLSARRR